MKTLHMMIGPPGSGKSTLAKKLESEGYVRVSQDDQGVDHFHVFDTAMLAGQNIVLDRMNFNKQQRDRYVGHCRDNGYRIEFTVIHQNRQTCFERCLARTDHPTIKDGKSASSALTTFFSKYERPEDSEADVVNRIWPEGAKDLAVICDLDGTLCNVDHRLHFVRTEGKKDWKSFFMSLSEDTPNEWCEALIHQMSEKHAIVFASGRPDDHQKATAEWLKQHGFSTTNLYMRCRGDHRQDYIAKEIILDFEILTRFKPLFFIDDRKQVVDLWRKRGFTCLACANGEF